MVTSCHFLILGFILFTMVRNTGNRSYKTGLDTDQWTWILSRLPLQHGGERETNVCNTVSVTGQREGCGPIATNLSLLLNTKEVSHACFVPGVWGLQESKLLTVHVKKCPDTQLLHNRHQIFHNNLWTRPRTDIHTEIPGSAGNWSNNRYHNWHHFWPLEK